MCGLLLDNVGTRGLTSPECLTKADADVTVKDNDRK